MKKIASITFIFAFVLNMYSQYPPPAGQEGSTAIHKDNSCFIAWASGCQVERGPMDISNPGEGNASYGQASNATGKPGINGTLSLGDGGSAILTFETPLANGQGWDFAIFENAFNDFFLELAFVEVSSDGTQFHRFDGVSLTQTQTQVETFGQLDATKIHNLAGKYRVEYGTPFDLQELENTQGLDVNNITHIKIIDAIGCIQDDFATYDSQGNKVNDPWPTPFEASGFDLDAIGVIHNTNTIQIKANKQEKFAVYPIPAENFIHMKIPCESTSVELINLQGITVWSEHIQNKGTHSVNIKGLKKGIYVIKLNNEMNVHRKKILIK